MVQVYVFIFFFLLLAPFFSARAASWAQDAGNAQRTGSTIETPRTPWTFAWTFNGPDSSGGTGSHLYDAPTEARTVTGGGYVFVPAGSRGLYAIALATGKQAWNLNSSAINAAPVYDENSHLLFAGAADGKIYKIDPVTGVVRGSYQTGTPINKALLLVDNFVYAVNSAGELHKVETNNLSKSWIYAATSAADTPPAYSRSRNLLVFATSDLHVHAVNNQTGTQKWRVKPSPNPPGWPNTFALGWPVVAEKHGIVLLRMQLAHEAMQTYPSIGHIFPDSFTTIRDWLVSNPGNKNLFALNLDNGQEKFIPAVGYGSTEDYINGSPHGVMGSQPVIKVWPDGSEVAYIHFRNGQGDPPDYRWDGHLGEMVLDDNTNPGLKAGDLRFINAARHHGGVGYSDIIDEQGPLTLNGNILTHSHWGASESIEITDRSPQKGLSFNSPISVRSFPTVVRAIKGCNNKDPATHYTTCNLSYVTDGGRYWSGPGFWVYWQVADPPGWKVGSGNTAGTAYSAGFRPRYTYVSDGYMIVEGNGGDIFALKHSGNTGPNPTPTPVSSQQSVGDANADHKVNGLDYVIWLTNYGQSATGPNHGDFNNNGKVDGVDYVLWLNNYVN